MVCNFLECGHLLVYVVRFWVYYARRLGFFWPRHMIFYFWEFEHLMAYVVRFWVLWGIWNVLLGTRPTFLFVFLTHNFIATTNIQVSTLQSDFTRSYTKISILIFKPSPFSSWKYSDFSQSKTEISTYQCLHRDDQHFETQVVKFRENRESRFFGI